MNCCNCGEEIKPGEIHGYVCKECMDAATEEQMKESGGLPLSPKEAAIAMLNGEILAGDELFYKDGFEAEWDGECFVSRIDGDTQLFILHSFKNLVRKPKPKTRPMDTFECLAWVNSPDSQGWMVSIQRAGNGPGRISGWDIPQRFKYDGKEGLSGGYDLIYHRARVLPDKSGIDETTIQGFLVEVV